MNEKRYASIWERAKRKWRRLQVSASTISPGTKCASSAKTLTSVSPSTGSTFQSNDDMKVETLLITRSLAPNLKRPPFINYRSPIKWKTITILIGCCFSNLVYPTLISNQCLFNLIRFLSSFQPFAQAKATGSILRTQHSLRPVCRWPGRLSWDLSRSLGQLPRMHQWSRLQRSGRSD